MEDDWEVMEVTDTIILINSLKSQFDTTSDIEQKKRYLVDIFGHIQLILKDSSVTLNEDKYLHFYENYLLKRNGIIWNMMKMFISDEKFYNEVQGLYTIINTAWNKKRNMSISAQKAFNALESKYVAQEAFDALEAKYVRKGGTRDRIKKGGKSKKKIQIIKKSKKIKKLKKSVKKRKNMKTKTYKKH